MTTSRHSSTEHSDSELIAVDDARTFVFAHLTPLESVERALNDTVGNVVTVEVRANEPTPSFTNSAMDGFALRANDTRSGQARLRLVDSIFAGQTSDVEIGAGEAARIMTGAPLPSGADSVCLKEATIVEPDGRYVIIERVIEVGEAVRHVGDDVQVGQTLVAPGDVVSPAMIGALASQGVRTLWVHRTPRVGVLSSGDEIADERTALEPGQIRDANRPALLATLGQSGFVPVDLGTVNDSPSALRSAFESAARECDAVISTGGVSAGDADYVKVVLGELFGSGARSMKVALRPGKPFTFAYDAESNTPFFALAGNPVSTLVGFELFVRPALRLLAGHRDLHRPLWSMVLDCEIPRHRDGKLHLIHAQCRLGDDGRLHVTHVARHGSHLLFAVAHANCLLFSPDGDGLKVNDVVEGLILDPSSVAVATV